jgi:O-antigen/teichoic acid export membrane protein
MPSDRNSRIAKNTLTLYFRQLLILFVNLYTVRMVLDVLGVQDYGIYSVVAGVVAVSSFLPNSLASATQRYFSFALGLSDNVKLRKTFSVNLVLYFGISVVSLLVLETIGLWFVTQSLSLPDVRFDAAILLYQFTVLTFVASIFSSPFIAIIIAHEDMRLYAYVSIFESLLKLLAVHVLMFISMDKLQLHGALILGIACINSAIYIAVCFSKYSECQVRELHWDTALAKDTLGFTGWTLFGQISTIGRTHAITILLNQMFNPAVVAARSIAVNVANSTNMFASNFNTGLYPPIIKAYAAGDQRELFSLVNNGSKLTFFLLWLFALPMIMEMEFILEIWLRTVPENTVTFTQLALIESLVFSLSAPIATAARAPGNMKLYELVLGTMQLGILLVSWIVLKYGAPAFSVFVVAILANVLMFFVRLLLVRRLIGLQILPFLSGVLLPVLSVVAASAIPAYLMTKTLQGGFGIFLVNVSACFAFSLIAMYFIGLDAYWRQKLREAFMRKIGLGRAQ